jgi:Predicted membrane protein (DUF2079)
VSRRFSVFLFAWALLPLVYLFTGPWTILGKPIPRFSAPLGVATVLAAASFCVASSARRWAMQRLGRPVTLSRSVSLLFLLLAAVFPVRIVTAKFSALEVNAWDFSNFFDRPIESVLHGRVLYSEVLGGSILGDHFRPLLFLFVPLYAVKATPMWLLLLQAAAVSAAMVVLFHLTRRLTSDDFTSILIVTAFALNSYTAKVLQYVFHLEIFYPFAILLLILGYTERRWALFLAGLLIAVSIKEDAIVVLLGFAIVALLHKRPAWALTALATGSAAFVLATYVVMPHFSHSAAGQPWYSPYWGDFGPTPLRAVLGMMLSPGKLLARVLRSGIPKLFETVGFIPLLGSEWALAAAPGAAVYGSAGNRQIAGLSVYYSAPLLAFVFAALPGTLNRIARLGVSSEEVALRRLRIGALFIALLSAFDGPGYRLDRPRPERKEIRSLLRTIPDSQALAVQGSLLPAAGYGSNLHPLVKFGDAPARIGFLLDPATNPYPMAPAEFTVGMSRLQSDPNYQTTRSPGGLFLILPREE